MTRKPTTSRSEIEAYRKKGLSYEEIGKVLGISKSGVGWHMQGRVRPAMPVEQVKQFLPWKITGDQVKAAPYRNVLLHLEYRETGGRGMSAEKLRKLRGFYNLLEQYGSVVRHDPELPPRVGQKWGGFEYVPRVESDQDFVLRFDRNTEVADENRDRWRIPPREDWPE